MTQQMVSFQQPDKPWTFHIVTLGCKINQYESQAIREAWQGFGGEEVELEAAPQVFLVNSCAITARGERDTRHAFYRWQRAHNENKSTCLRILTGCAAHLVEKSLNVRYNRRDNTGTGDVRPETYFDVLIPPRAKALLMQNPWHLEAFKRQDVPIPAEINPFSEQEGFFISSFARTRPVLKVQDGCSHRCTYCIVPLVRGKSISRAPQQVVLEAQRLLEAGHREIMLSGINLHHYGRDLAPMHDNNKQWDFWDLVRLLEKSLAPEWGGRMRLRISSLEPSQLNSKGIEVFLGSSLLCPHLHLSLQHGSPKVLKSMGRGHYSLEELTNSLHIMRKHLPQLGLGADILMGFAGEQEDDVVQTLNLIKEINLSYAHVFPYSIRPNTAAAAFDKQVPHKLKLQRAARVRQLVQEQKQAFLHSLLQEKTLQVVFDGQMDENADHGHMSSLKGVDAHYVACKLITSDTTTQATVRGIVPVRPLNVEDDNILVTL